MKSSVNPSQIEHHHHNDDSMGERMTDYVKSCGYLRIRFVIMILVIVHVVKLISFDVFGGFTCDQLSTDVLSIHGDVAVAPDDKKNDMEDSMTALDRRMLKYFQTYFYVPPVPKQGLARDIPAKECGAAPAFDSFFRLDSRQRSANNEDKWIYQQLFLGKSNETMMENNVPGTFVEIGAFNGMQESNSRFFEVCLGWEGLLVEGQPGNYRGVLQNRPFAHKMSFAPSCDAEFEKVNKTIQFANYPMTNAGLKGHAKTYDAKPHVDVPCGPFAPVLEDIFAFSNKRINFFSLDVEGAEYLILKTIDFSKVTVDVFMIEIRNNHCNQNCEVREKVREKMSAEGYLRYEGLIPKSDIYIHPKSIYQLPSNYKAANA